MNMKGCEGQGDMMEMMSKMMEDCEPDMMTEMASRCLGMMLPKMPKEKRTDFISKMVGTLVEQGCSGQSEQEKKDFLAKVIEKVTA
jgi:hypothetical protein